MMGMTGGREREREKILCMDYIKSDEDTEN